MNNENEYTPREIELLDEFAKAAMRFLTEYSPKERIAAWSYDTAAAMIAERRKRVPYTTVAEDPSQGSAQGLYTAPVAQPEPEKGELTEEAVAQWVALARDEAGRIDGGFWVDDDEIDRAVALMREGLRAKRERDIYKRLLDEGARAVGHAAEKERDEARETLADLRQVRKEEVALTEQWRARAEKAESELASVQPVLDAVARYMDSPCSMDGNVLRAYADRRREQAKGAS